jgi:SAM-dependent methyltransferase
VAEAPVAYVRGTLGIPAIAGDIREKSAQEELSSSGFDVVTLWYVIEHFPDLASMLETLSKLVRVGGLLALSTPYGRGVSARRSPESFFRNSPRDHFTIWDRESANGILARYGFSVERFVSTGHHPERYPLVKKRLFPKGIAAVHSRLAGWGDTFEIYARKTRQTGES